MKLTCVTATFNCIASGRRESLIRCVRSVAALKTVHEHLIYDGASTDGTVELLRELESKTPGLKVVSEPDIGIYNALNKGVRDAQGEWFYVLGSDDYIMDPKAVDDIMAGRAEDVDAFCASVRIEDANGRLLTVFTPRFDEIYNHPSACHQGEMIRTSLARDLGGFDERFKIAADSDMFLKAHYRGVRFGYDERVIAFFLGGGMSGNAIAAEREHRMSVADVLGLDERERTLLLERHVLTFTRCFTLMRHGDAVISGAAKAMIANRVVKRVKSLLRTPLYPLVVLTRSVRSTREKRKESL